LVVELSGFDSMCGLWFKYLNHAIDGANIFMSISKRLKSERERLGLSQPQLGELVKAGKTTVINWEKGASAPDAVQLAAIAAAGADVLYILTGQHAAFHAALGHVRTASEMSKKLGGTDAQKAQTTEVLFNELHQPPLTKRQRALLDNYENAPEAGKKVIEQTASFAAQPKTARGGE
jgi:transcriptional regulator with XRE-family HTH domain